MHSFLNALFFVAYLLSAIVQYNDPDALPWILIYLAASLNLIAVIIWISIKSQDHD